MKWFLAGLAFAAVVGLAIATASIESENIAMRARMQVEFERLEAVRVSLLAERERFDLAANPEALARLWLQIEAAFREAGS